MLSNKSDVVLKNGLGLKTVSLPFFVVLIFALDLASVLISCRFEKNFGLETKKVLRPIFKKLITGSSNLGVPRIFNSGGSNFH